MRTGRENPFIRLKGEGFSVLLRGVVSIPSMKSPFAATFIEVFFCVVFFAALGLIVATARDFRREILPESQFLRLDLSALLSSETPAELVEEEDLPTMRQRSDQLERSAREARAEGRRETAISLLQEARVLQEEVNRRNPGSRFADRLRSTALGREMENWRAEPHHDAAVAAQERAREAAAEGNFEEAREALTEAIEEARLLIRDHSRSRFYNPNFLRALETEFVELETRPLVNRRDAALDEARRAAREGNLEEAQDRFLEARQLQDIINLDFPDSPHVSPERWEEIERERQNVLSRGLAGEIRELLVHHQGEVAQGNWEAANRDIRLARTRLESFAREFPESGELSAATRRTVEFLSELGAARQQIAGEIEAALRPVPGVAGVRMLSVEVSQDLYRRVTGRNPSRQVGPDLPVDSISWPEAMQFAEEMTLILARPVRLPREVEFRAALGGEFAPERVWSAQTSGGQSHPVDSQESNEHGFFHLRGNVAEWVADREGNNVVVVGGSYNTPEAEFSPYPRILQPPSYRARTVGFRLVVEDRDP